MKKRISSLAIRLAVAFCLGVSKTSAELEVSASVQIHAASDFYAPLSAHGTWVEVGSYGRCWHPAHVAAEWRPYCSGYWEWTDCGWYWVSDEPWAWACYHYGSWVDDSSYGWIWIPDIEWGPSWVSWRVGGGFIGWAPLPPRHLGFLASVSPPAPPFVFVETSHFREPVSRSALIVNDKTIIQKTTVINNIRVETRSFNGSAPRKVIFNEGPPVADIQKATAKSVGVVPVHEAISRTPVPQELKRTPEVRNDGLKQPPSIAPHESHGNERTSPGRDRNQERGHDGKNEGKSHGHDRY